ncbi:hypothetical protein KJ780_01035 [Candidatus Micrarchaeota archaeon]|nr:hypothetical protein [Candidatus Micrarchaeota archaeon]
MKRKGQAAMEFFVYLSIFLAALLASYVTITFIQNSELEAKKSDYAFSFGEQFSSAFDLAAKGGENFNYTVRFNRLLLANPYTVQFKPAAHGFPAFAYLVTPDNATYSYPIISINIKHSTCILKKTFTDPHSGDSWDYYQINSSLGMLNLYNDGENITLSQTGC